MKYALETPDAVHVLCAVQYSSNYLVMIDRPLINAKVKEIEIIDPGTLITKSQLRFY
jgi:predicted nucleic acid-binding protein